MYLNQLEYLARTDELTQAFNRRYFLLELEKEVDRSRRYKSPLSVLILDLDYFKDVNDTYGHASGDAVLQALSAACSSILRTADVFARLGGEEFGILLPETGPEEAVQTAERVRKLVQQLKVTADNGDSIRFTASLGVAFLREDDQGLESLLQRADRALYAAKDAGRNRVEYKD